MANLSNINGKFVVEQTTGYVGIGNTDPAFPLEVKFASAELALNATGASIYRLKSDSTDYFRINKNGVGDRLVISGGGDVGIGTSTPTQGKVDILDAGAYSAHTGHGLTINSNASNAYTSMYMGADDTIDAIYIQSAGRNTSFTTKKLLLNPNGGNVGIGTDSPVSKLSINSNGIPIFAAAAMATTGLTIHNSTGGTAIQIGTYDAGSYNYIQSGYVNSAGTPRDLKFYNGSINSLTLDTSGYVGIGTDSPACILNIEDSVASTAPATDANNLLLIENTNAAGSCNIRLRGGDGATRIMYGHNVTGEDKLYITPRANDNPVIFDGSGNVEVSGNITIHDSSNAPYIDFVESGATSDSKARITMDQVDTNNGQLIFSTEGSGTLTERMRITSAGNVLITSGGGTFDTGALSGSAKGVNIQQTVPIMLVKETATNNRLYMGMSGALGFVGSPDNISLRISTSDTSRIEILSGGNVGIGTTSPGAKLEVTTSTAGWSSIIQNTNGASDANGLLIKAGTVSSEYSLKVSNSTDSTNFMVVKGNGNVGIGTTGPSKKLDVQGAGGDGIRVSNSTNSAYYSDLLINYNDVSSMQLICMGTSILQAGNTGNTVLASRTNKDIILSPSGTGNVGIGVTNPDESLEVAGNIKIEGATPGTQSLIINGGVTSTFGISLQYAGVPRAVFDFYPGSGQIRIGGITTNDEYPVIYSDGVASLTFGLGAAPNAAFNGQVLVGKGTNSDVSIDGHRFDANGNTFTSIINAEATYYVRDTTNSLYRFYVTGAGQVHATSTSITAISDVTLKENIKPLETGLDEVMKLQPRRFDWKNGDGENIAGFIAQEVEEVLPDLVSDSKYDDDIVKKSLKMGDMIPTLVKAIQELKAEIDILKNK